MTTHCAAAVCVGTFRFPSNTNASIQHQTALTSTLTFILNYTMSIVCRHLTGKIRKRSAYFITMTQRDVKTKTHYEGHSSSSYESAFFYEPGVYQEYLRDKVRARLRLTSESNHTLIDIGGGTGNFTRTITEGTRVTAIVVDPFLDSSDEATNKTDSIQFVKAAAEDYKDPPSANSWRTGYSQVLLKEVIHHIAAADRVPVLRGIREGLSTSGVEVAPAILIITRPQREIDYPLWLEAREVWAQNQPSLEELVHDLKKAGFHNIEHTVEAYECRIPLARWKDMVKARFWSTFSSFSDHELAKACDAIEQNETERTINGNISFEDRLLFIVAS